MFGNDNTTTVIKLLYRITLLLYRKSQFRNEVVSEGHTVTLPRIGGLGVKGIDILPILFSFKCPNRNFH